VGGHHGAVARQCQSQSLRQAVHRVGGKHARAGAAGGAGRPFDLKQVFVSDAVISGSYHGVDKIDGFSSCPAGLHRTTGDKHRGDIESHGGHQHAGGDLVAVADAYHRVSTMGIAYILYTVGNKLARRERIEHSGMPHGYAIIYGYGIELSGEHAEALNLLFHSLPDIMQVHMARNELRE